MHATILKVTLIREIERKLKRETKRERMREIKRARDRDGRNKERQRE